MVSKYCFKCIFMLICNNYVKCIKSMQVFCELSCLYLKIQLITIWFCHITIGNNLVHKITKFITWFFKSNLILELKYGLSFYNRVENWFQIQVLSNGVWEDYILNKIKLVQIDKEYHKSYVLQEFSEPEPILLRVNE